MRGALLRLHGIVFLWGFTAIIGKLITAQAPTLVFYRMGLATLFLWMMVRVLFKKSLGVSRKMFWNLIAIGACMAIHWLCFFHSIKVSNVSIALSCLSLGTLFAAFMEPLVFRRKIDPMELITGLVVLVCVGLIFNVELDYQEGILYGIVTALFGTVFSVLNGKLFGKTSSESIIFYEMMGGFLFVALFYLVTGQIGETLQISSSDFFWTVLLASVFTAYPMLESVKLMKYISPFTLILTVNLEPIYGIFFAFFIFGESEHMNPVFYVASGVMVSAIFLNAYLKSRKKKISDSASL